MASILILECDSIFNIGIAARLGRENKHVIIDNTGSINEVFQKPLFSKEKKDYYDLFIISIHKQQDELISFIKYVICNKPELSILIFSYESSERLQKYGIHGAQEKGRSIKKVSCWQDIQQEVEQLVFIDTAMLFSVETKEINGDFSIFNKRVANR